MEDFDHAGAVKVHASVRDSLIGVEKPSKKDMISTLFKDFGTRLNQMDKQGAPRLLGALKAYLDNYDSQKTPFATIQKYTEYRILNVGYRLVVVLDNAFPPHCYPHLTKRNVLTNCGTASWIPSCNGRWA